MILEDHLADRLLLILVHGVRKDRKPVFLVSPCFFHTLGQNADVLFSLLLDVRKDSLLHLFTGNQFLQSGKYFFRYSSGFVSMLRLSDLSYNLVDEIDDRQVDFVALVDGLDHLLFLYFLRAGFNHDHLGGRGSDSKLKVTLIPLLLGRVDDELAVDQSHLRHGAGTVKGDI